MHSTVPRLRALCVGRHTLLAEHLACVFERLGLDTRGVVGLDQAHAEAREVGPDVVICEYELLATIAPESWERDPLLSMYPVVAVSLTHQPHEATFGNMKSVVEFLYLPRLDPDAAMRIITAAGSASRRGQIKSSQDVSSGDSMES